MIIDELMSESVRIMTDNYGNYLFKELIKQLKPSQRIKVLSIIKGKRFMEIACQGRGTWTLQNFINAISEDKEFEIIKASLLEGSNIVKLARN